MTDGNHDNENNKDNENQSNENTRPDIATPHDVTFKKAMENPETAKDIIECNLPPEILEDIDWQTLQPLDGSFTSKDLKETFKDVLYGVEMAGNDVYFAFPFEHKSSADKLAIFQVARYIIDLWESSLKDTKEIPIVIPVIFYHGKESWNYHTDIRKYIRYYDELPDYLKSRLPTMQHDFINLQVQGEDIIQTYQPITRTIIRAFKYIYSDKDTLIKAFLICIEEMHGQVPKDEMERVIGFILIYFSNANKDFTEAELMRKVRELDGKGEEIMTILQERERKGIKQGRQEGRQEERRENVKSLIKEGVPADIILRAFKLSKEELEEIQKDL